MLALFALTILAATDAAPVFTAAPNSSFSFDLDASPGYFDTWEALDLAGLSAADITVRPGKTGSSPRWGPVFRINLVAGEALCGVQIAKSRYDPDFSVTIVQMQGKQIVLSRPLALRAKIGADTTVLVTWSATQATFRIGDVAETVALPEAPSKLRLLSSTGEFRVEKLQLGRTGTP